jgi:hypothetical protein
LKTKIEKLKIFFIPYPSKTYGKKAVYNFVDFRIKSAGSSNYGGLTFFAMIVEATMAVDKKSMTKGKTKPKELYLKIPYHILNITGIGLCEKVLLAHIYSFGEKGCWQSNATLGKMFFVDGRTISRWLARLKKNALVLWVHPKGRYRTIWAKSHPNVKTAAALSYMGEQISTESVISGHAAAILQRQNCPGAQDKPVLPTATNQCIQVGQNCPHTNNTTKKDITSKTTAPPSPLPAGGQTPAVLTERKSQAARSVEDIKKRFGIGRKCYQPPSEQEVQNRRQAQLKALLAAEH